MEKKVGSHPSSASSRPSDPSADSAHPDLAGLLKDAAGGDERAWRTLVDLYARRVYALARSRLGGGKGGARRAGEFSSGPWGQGSDVAEEVTQSVFVTVASKLNTGEYAEQGRFESWLFRVAMNRIRDEARRIKRHAEPTDPEAFAGVGGVGDGRDHAAARAAAEESEESIRGLRLAMEQLPEADREIVELRHHAGLSFKQMADLLDEPIGTLLARHHRALKKLKDLITAERPTPELAGDDR